jgi:hypothetical protein
LYIYRGIAGMSFFQIICCGVALTSIMMGEAAGQKQQQQQQQRAGENTFEEGLLQLQQRRGRASNENVP